MEAAVQEMNGDQEVLSLAAKAPGQERACDEAAVRAGGEASTTSKGTCQSSSPLGSSPIANLRSSRHQRTNSFQRWKKQMQRVWRWGPTSNREQGMKTSVNLEAMANQKRQWYQIHSESRGHKQQKEPVSLFEHFFIVGLHSCANMEPIEDAFAKRKTWESEVAKSEIFDLRKLQYHGRLPILEPQVLFKYPPGKRLAMRERDLPAFCFPGGIEARLMERTPSMSDLNEVVFGQEHQARDDLSFIFCLKASDNATLYGVCLHVQEIVQRAPGILGSVSPLTQTSGRAGRFLVSAPRCYCILTRVPFFELHYEMLNSLIAQERLERITQFVNEMSLMDYVPRGAKDYDQLDENLDSLSKGSSTAWMDSAIPVDGFLVLTAPQSGLISDKDIPFSFRTLDPGSPESAITSEASDFAYIKEIDKDGQRSPLYIDDFASESSDSHSDSFERANGSYENDQISPPIHCSASQRFECLESLDSVYRDALILDSSVRSVRSDCEEDEVNSKYEKVVTDEKVMQWAKANNNEELQIVCGYHALPIPLRGSEIVFCPLEHLQPVKYSRPGISALGLSGTYSDVELSYPSEVDEVNARLAAAEEALALSIWTTATVCRALSLESILALFAGALLEKQIVVICPNLVLPRKMLDFLDAPVPFIVGIQHKPADLKIKTANLIRVNVCKDQQAEGARQFLNVLRNYLESLCSNLRSHTITSVRSNNDRVSLLLKESFVDSFPNRDRPFIKHFVDTQMFSVLSDSRLSSYENEYL